MSKIIGTLEINGKKIVLRYPKISDYRKCQRFYNQAIKESLRGDGLIAATKPVTLKSEKKRVADLVRKIKQKKEVCILAESDGRIIGNTHVSKGDFGATEHVGNFGIAILEEFTDKGLGTRMMDEIIKLAKKELRIEIIKLSVFSNNKRAQKLYKKLGFREIGRIRKGRKIKGVYADEIIMLKYLK